MCEPLGATSTAGAVLIVDDSATKRALFAHLARASGYAVEQVGGGREALARLERDGVDLVLLDLMMPEVDGLAVLAALHQRGRLPALPVVVVTSTDDPAPRHEALRLGAADFLTTPVDEVEFAARVRNLIQLRRLQGDAARAAEQELARREASYRALVQASPDLILRLSPEGVIRFISRSVGPASPAQLVGTSGLDHLEPVDRQTAERALARAAASDEVVEYTVRARRGDGSMGWYANRLLRVPGSDGSEIIAYATDITDQHAARQRADRALARQEMLTEHLPLVLWQATAGATGALLPTWFSGSAQRVLGVEPRRLTGDDSWASSIHPDDAPRVAGEVRAHLTAGVGSWSSRFRWCMPDAAPTELLVAATRVDTPGPSASYFGFALDVSDTIELERALRQSQKMEAVGLLAGGVAHDFNNLLTVIQSYAGFVRDDLPPEHELQEDLGEVLGAADKAAALTRQLLTFARRDSADKRAVDLNESLAGMASMLRRTLGAHIEMTASTAARPAIVCIDPVQVDQVLMNLVVNARDAMPGGGALHVDVALVDRVAGDVRPREVLIRVTDTGHGMDEPTRERIFDPFFTTKEKGRGTGLGLATCYGIVAEAGGSIDVTSELGRGSQFTVRLPMCDDVVAEQELGVRAESAATGETILVAEDGPALRRVMDRALSAAGYQVILASDGAEAIGLLEARHGDLDLLVTDVVMPGADGHAVARRAAELRPDLPILMTSGYLETPELLVSGRPLLWKPYSVDVLLRAVASALAGRPSESSDRAAAPAERPRPEATPAGRETAPRILVVEDDASLAATYRRLLEPGIAQIDAAATCERGLELLGEGQYDAVITDIGLPDGTGMDILRAAHALDPDLPVIVITGAPSLETAMDAVRGHAAEYLAKPFDAAELRATIAASLESRRAARLQRQLVATRAGADDFFTSMADTRRLLDEALPLLWMAYQPIVRAGDGSVFAYEALLRCDHETLSNPPRVLAAAEILGRIRDVGRTVRAAVAADLADHPERQETIFVNLHPSEFSAGLLCADDEPLLRSARRVVLEVTERASLATPDELDRERACLREAGFRVAVDDLGEGYAGLASLVKLRPDVAKIDMSIVRDVDRSTLKQGIIASMVRTCRQSGITVVAEGVETREERDTLTTLGCDLLQGYFFARPGRAFPRYGH